MMFRQPSLQLFIFRNSQMQKAVRNSSTLLVCLIILVAVHGYPTFPEYYELYNRTYTVDGQQYNMRQEIYEERIANFSQITGFEPGVNNLTDRMPYEILQMKGGKKATPVGTRVGNSGDKIKVRASLPTSLDWRDFDIITSVKNQGSCGSCWEFGPAAIAQSYLILNKNYNNSVDLSEQFVLQCTRGSTCDGGWPRDAIKTIVRYGINLQQQHPYDPYAYTYGVCKSTSINFDEGRQRTYYNAGDDEIIELLQSGPLSITISTENWEYYSSGVLVCPPDIPYTDHVVQLVGYDNDYWIIKNQWGRGWGISGYARVTRNRNNNCLIGEEVSYISHQQQEVSGELLMRAMMWMTIILVAFGGC